MKINDFKTTVLESYPQHQDLSGIATDRLKAYLAKQGQQQSPGEGRQVQRVRAELQRRSQSVAEGKEDKIAQLKKDHATAVHWSKNETSPHKREAARQKAEKIKSHLEKQYKQGVAEGIGGLGYDAQSLITKLRRDVEEKRLQPTPQAVLAAARELAGDMEFAPQLLVQQVLGKGLAEGSFDNYSPMAKDSVKQDKIRSLKNLIAIAKEKGRQLRVQELELELKKLQGVAEGEGRFAGDTHVDVGGVTMKMIQVGDIVKYFGQKAEVVALSKDRKRARITIERGMGGITQDVNTSDLKQLGQGMREGSDDTVGFSVNSEPAYQAVMSRFGDHVDHDETSGIMYVPTRMWPQVELVAFDADGEGATRADDDVYEDSDPEYDDEAGMADNNLETLRRAVEGIDDVISEGDNLPEWCQEKIAVAKSMLVSVWDYMKSEEERGDDSEQEDPEIVAMYEAMEDLAQEMAAKHRVSVDTVWENFESMEDHVLYETAAWRRKEGKSKSGGLNAKGVASYRRENPGSKLQTAVTTKPSKLKPGSKAAKRRKSFCARMGGVKGPMKKPNGKPTRKALALRKWNC